MFEYS